ncbi:MAG: N-acetylmuramoyl-L-alanine amidase [Paramuribaculum sp.]|nr:N-acetylmuramoyl-L-alanine amidase [Paramuribaculum sp.]MDE6304473.1 N-acetylmuramoyl-L-alanine amidase [Paramuribaculum sp.]
MRIIDKIIIHCTATPFGRDVNAAEIDLWHRGRGWKAIGYHYLVKLDGTIEAGRPERQIGAHCRGQNARSIGIAYVGGIDARGKCADTRTDAQKKSLLSLITTLLDKYPQARVFGHRDFSSKECPCFDATGEYYALARK